MYIYSLYVYSVQYTLFSTLNAVRTMFYSDVYTERKFYLSLQGRNFQIIKDMCDVMVGS